MFEAQTDDSPCHDLSPCEGDGLAAPCLSPIEPQTRISVLDRLKAIEWHLIDWAPDLAEEIGSRRWVRGVAKKTDWREKCPG